MGDEELRSCAKRCHNDNASCVLDDDKDLNTCSLQDVIDTEKEDNERATAVLGASDSTNCSYDNGYVYRQALYGCATCFKENKQLNGICLACSYSCHANHELYELYTKRNFRCDCGNEKFSVNGLKCKLQPNKDPFNAQNLYNHNFNGRYCVCDKPYLVDYSNKSLNESGNADDLDTSIGDDEMIQCTICEDWFHFSHLSGYEQSTINTNDDYDEMICHQCMNKHKFLWYYQGYIAIKIEKTNELLDDIDIENTQNNNSNNDPEIKHKCHLDELKHKHSNIKLIDNQTCFLLNDWRKALCKCEKCLNFYELNGIKYLIDDKDPIKYYEDIGKENTQKIDENMLINNELSKLNRFSQVEFLHNLNNFKQELKDFLANFANNGEIVKRENVEEFFDNLNQRKKQKLENNQTEMSYYCK